MDDIHDPTYAEQYNHSSKQQKNRVYTRAMQKKDENIIELDNQFKQQQQQLQQQQVQIHQQQLLLQDQQAQNAEMKKMLQQLLQFQSNNATFSVMPSAQVYPQALSTAPTLHVPMQQHSQPFQASPSYTIVLPQNFPTAPQTNGISSLITLLQSLSKN